VIHVVGGTYLELCPERKWFELFGSGLRASHALKRLKTRVHFHTFAGANQKNVLLARSDNITLHPTDTRRTIGFNYLHTISRPSMEPVNYIRYCMAKPRVIELSEDKILRFGMVEGSAKVDGKMVTYDPQTADGPQSFHANGSRAERLAVVANQREAEQMTRASRPEAACKALLRGGAEVAVVKCGPDGCLVGTARGVVRVPAYLSRRTWPIGSGDVFSAIFAHGWMEEERGPVEAADRASRGTSYFVEAGEFPTEDDLQKKKFKPLKRLPWKKQKKVYLAGPFFNLAQRWLIEEFRNALLDAKVKVFSPLHDVGRGEAKVVYGPDMKGLKESGVVLACLDGLDPGTIYEIGYAHSLKAKVICFVSSERPEDLKMIEGGGSEMTNDFATAVYLTVWAATCK
jgi:nucleoside 2-deoxyribosyltransferase